MRSKLALLPAILLTAAACGGGGAASLQVGNVPQTVNGNVVTIPVEVEGVKIVKADGDDSGDTGHFHVFIDREPPAVGEVVPKEEGIVHSADNPIKLYGIEPSGHAFTVVLGDGTHTRIGEDAEDTVRTTVLGPFIGATADATIDEGDDLEITMEARGIDITKDASRYHVLVDPDEAPEPAAKLPGEDEDGVYVTTKSKLTVPGLDKGEHTIYVVAADARGTANDPPVMDKLTVTVG